ncbi:hypothetical protein AB0M43_37210 [Longispora sp. NPDC051575]|uniref:hypothetical protein n=1 Tax=Longispora sp. NPDC051575 TaxID=3154943 RepID=UPI00341BD437
MIGQPTNVTVDRTLTGAVPGRGLVTITDPEHGTAGGRILRVRADGSHVRWTPAADGHTAALLAVCAPSGVLAMVIAPSPAQPGGAGPQVAIALAVSEALTGWRKAWLGLGRSTANMSPAPLDWEPPKEWLCVPHLVTVTTGDQDAHDRVVWELVTRELAVHGHGLPVPSDRIRADIHARLADLLLLRTRARQHALPHTAAGRLVGDLCLDGPLGIQTIYAHAADLLAALRRDTTLCDRDCR